MLQTKEKTHYIFSEFLPFHMKYSDFICCHKRLKWVKTYDIHNLKKNKIIQILAQIFVLKLHMSCCAYLKFNLSFWLQASTMKHLLNTEVEGKKTCLRCRLRTSRIITWWLERLVMAWCRRLAVYAALNTRKPCQAMQNINQCGKEELYRFWHLQK